MLVESTERRCKERAFMTGKAIQMPTVSVESDVPDRSEATRLRDSRNIGLVGIDDEYRSLVFDKDVVRLPDSVKTHVTQDAGPVVDHEFGPIVRPHWKQPEKPVVGNAQSLGRQSVDRPDHTAVKNEKSAGIVLMAA